MKASRLALAGFLALCLGGCLRRGVAEDLSDPVIKARLESRLQAEPELDVRYVTLDVHSGVVTVSGLVNTQREKQAITRIARGEKGVEQAIVNVIVQE